MFIRTFVKATVLFLFDFGMVSQDLHSVLARAGDGAFPFHWSDGDYGKFWRDFNFSGAAQLKRCHHIAQPDSTLYRATPREHDRRSQLDERVLTALVKFSGLVDSIANDRGETERRN